MQNMNKTKIDSVWQHRADLKPFNQCCSDYVPVYSDKSRSPTAISDEKWPIPGRSGIDSLSKYGYSSHKVSKSPGCESIDDWEPSEQNKQKKLFDNCYNLGECRDYFIFIDCSSFSYNLDK